ncbi:MAG: hypothetical protein FWC34_01275 [Bacteroidetes bacterium]|nr:hypothetical protein [Bacteroidota bacterium]
MNEIKIVVAKKELIYQAPEAFDEMTREQFILTAEKIIHIAAGIDNDNYYPTMTGMEKKIWDKLHFFQRYSIKRLFDFITLVSPPISKQLLPYIETGKQQFIGYQPSFSNTTWQEFIFADQYVMSGKYREAAACLYRPQRQDYTGETDRRIPFTIYGTNSRMSFFNNIPEAELFAFILNYKSLRKRNIEEKYPFIFSPKAQSTSQNNSTFSWVAIHRDLMGDHFYDETKFYELNVHVILNRLNTVIKDNRKRPN